MVKLQRRFAYRYGEKEHFKYVVTVPSELVEKLGWRPGDELEPTAEGNKLVINRTRIESSRGG